MNVCSVGRICPQITEAPTVIASLAIGSSDNWLDTEEIFAGGS